MASADLENLRRWYQEESHPVWYRSFPTPERRRMVEDDLSAGYRIPSLLTAIVLFGLTTMVITVLLAI